MRVPRAANDENAPAATRLGAATRHTRAISNDIAKNNVLASKETLKPALSTGTATTRARPALALQRANSNAAATTNIVVGKRKRDALGDATNGKGKTAASTLLTKAAGTVDKPSSTATSSTITRASSVSVQTKENAARTTKENPTRARSALGVKPKNVVSAAPPAKDEKTALKGAKTEEETTGKVVARKPLGAKAAQTTTTTVTNVVKSRKVVSAVEKKTRVEKVQKIEVKVEETDEEDAARVHKRPRLSELEQVEVKELATITVENVQKVLEKTFVKPEDEEADDLDKDDVDDPLMVAEYVVEIFDYLYELEVCFLAFMISCSYAMVENHHAQPKVHELSKGFEATYARYSR